MRQAVAEPVEPVHAGGMPITALGRTDARHGRRACSLSCFPRRHGRALKAALQVLGAHACEKIGHPVVKGKA